MQIDIRGCELDTEGNGNCPSHPEGCPIQLLPAIRDGLRVETGAVQFGPNDWPGLFLRGDDAFALDRHLHALEKYLETHLIAIREERAVYQAFLHVLGFREIIADKVDVTGTPVAAKVIREQLGG
jgi:hypothetical protein